MDPNQPQQLDQDAVRLAKAIRFSESRDKEDAKGASGEFGLYQFMPDTWASTTKKYNLNAADVSRENQNKAAYMQIKELKDAGHTPDQIAAYWNMGEKGLTDYSKNVGTNKYGVKYDTPAYVNVVKDAYNRLKQNEATPLEQIGKGPSTPGNEQFGTPDPVPANGELLQDPALKSKINPVVEVAKGFAKGVGQDVLGAASFGEKVANQTAGRLINAFQGKGFTPLSNEQLGDASTANDESPSMKAANESLKSRNAYQTGGKVAEFGASLLIPGKGAKTVIDSRRLAQASSKALEIAGEKMTPNVAKGLLKSGDVAPDVKKGATAITDLVKKGVLKVGDDAKTATSNANALRTEIGNKATDLIKRLRSMPNTPIAQPEDLTNMLVKANAEAADSLSHSPEKTKQIFDKFVSYLPKGKDIDAADILDARKQLDAWIQADKGGKVFDPTVENAVSSALRAIRHGANDLADKLAPDQAVKDALEYQTSLYRVLENIAAKGAKGVQEADQIAKMKGLKGFQARRPLLSGALKYTGIGLLGSLGFKEGINFLGE